MPSYERHSHLWLWHYSSQQVSSLHLQHILSLEPHCKQQCGFAKWQITTLHNKPDKIGTFHRRKWILECQLFHEVDENCHDSVATAVAAALLKFIICHWFSHLTCSQHIFLNTLEVYALAPTCFDQHWSSSSSYKTHKTPGRNYPSSWDHKCIDRTTS
jgi:hypothetical protein